jgi:hypothetical protein
VAFAQALTDEGYFDPMRVWSITRLIESMLAALDSDDLQVLEDEKTGRDYVLSSQTFADHDRESGARMGKSE